MSCNSLPPSGPWHYIPLPEDYLHPLSYLRPDVILHVYELWKEGKQDDPAHRSFALRDISKIDPFAMMGGIACTKFIVDWKITDADITFLNGIPSLEKLPIPFWNYLRGFTGFSGSVKALPEGRIMGLKPINVSPELKAEYGDEPIGLDLVQIDGKAAEVALVSMAFSSILDFSIFYSKNLLADKLAKEPPTFYLSEREIHPFWGHLAATIEYLLGHQSPLEARDDTVWLWIDDERADTSSLLVNAENVLGPAEKNIMLLIRKEMARKS